MAQHREYYAYSFENTALAAGTGTVFADTLVRLDNDAEFEILSRIHVATSDLIFCRFSDDSFGRYQQNNDIDLRMVSGRSLPLWAQTGTKFTMAFLPGLVATPYSLAPGSVVTASFADASGIANSIRQTWHGAKILSGPAPWDRQWDQEINFTYTTKPFVVAANGTTSFSLGTGMDAHFLVEHLKAVRTGAALITIKDGTTDRQWMDKAVHIDNLFGNAIFPHKLQANRFITRGAPISIGVTDISGASNTVELVFGGTKLVGNIKGIDDIRPTQRG